MPSWAFPKLFKLPAAKINGGRLRRNILKKLSRAKLLLLNLLWVNERNLKYKRFQKGLLQLCPPRERPAVGAHVLTHTVVCVLCVESIRWPTVWVLGLWSGCCVNGGMQIQKAFLLMTVLKPRGKHGYTCGGCLSHTTISDTPNEPVMDSAHKSTCGHKCNYGQKKNSMVYLEKLGPGGDLRTQMKWKLTVRPWRMEGCGFLDLSVAHQANARSMVSSSFLRNAGKSQKNPACRHQFCKQRFHLLWLLWEHWIEVRSFKVLSDLESVI